MTEFVFVGELSL